MDISLLEDLGLTNVQARAYQALIMNSTSTAPTIAEHLGESRSNAYKVLDKLCELGLAIKEDSGKRVHYAATSPATLERLIQQQANQVQSRERRLNAALPGLLDFFFVHSEQPSIRYFQGKEGIHRIFGDMLHTGKNIYLLRSPADVHFYDEGFFAEFRKKRAALGIKTYALTPNVSSAIHDSAIDLKNNFIRTWIPADTYTGQVEWDIYGDKVALISYGAEAMGIVIESPQIAESFRQMFQLVRTANEAIASDTQDLDA